MKNKKAQSLVSNKLIVALLCAAVLVIVIFGAYKLGITDYFQNLPLFNRTTIRTDLIVDGDVAGQPVKILLDDGNARCIIYDGFKQIVEVGNYGLLGGRLVYTSESAAMSKKWEFVDEMYIASADKEWTRDFYKVLGQAVGNMKATDPEGKTVGVFLTRAGLKLTYRGSTYFFDGKTIFKSGDKWEELKNSEKDYWTIQSLFNSALPGVEFKGDKIEKLKVSTYKYQGSQNEFVLLYAARLYNGYFYGITGSGGIVETFYLTQILKKDFLAGNNQWRVIRDEYLYNDAEWQELVHRKQVKDDLTKICIR